MRRLLAERYRIERVIGEGGMATVYLAEDLKHRRMVAVKVMRPELAATLGADRFLREVEIAAQFNHPHILPMYDSGETEGVLYYVMPYVEGESLATRLARAGELPVPEALRLGREVAEALAYAHRHGIIHRDIKPANILLNEGHALVADFGIARALHADGEAITRTGLAIGTPHYMSPEQSTGDKSVDARTDIYALGAVIYEMLTGEPPFTGRSPQAVVARSLTERPRPLAATRERLPDGLEDVVSKSLARNAVDRYPTAAALAQALASVEAGAHAAPRNSTVSARVRPAARIWLTVGLVTLLAIGAMIAWATWWGARPSQSMAASNGVTHVAVLPFQNQGDSANDYIVDGITDEVRGKLSQVTGLAVIASGSSAQYRGSRLTPQEIARELGVQYLLVGRVRWAPGADDASRRVQVVAELENGATGATTWQQTFDANLTDVFAVQTQLAARVASALGAELGARETQDLARRPTRDPVAWDAYLRGKAIKRADPASLRQAVASFEQAVALDAGFADAWAALSRANRGLYIAGSRDPAAARRAREAALRAIELAPENAAGYAAAGVYYFDVEPDPARSTRYIETALRISPNDPDVLQLAARAAVAGGHADRAIPLLGKARGLDPRSVAVLQALSDAFRQVGNFTGATEALESAIAISAPDPSLYQGLAIVKLAEGDLPAAREVARRAASAMSPAAVAAFYAGYQEMSWALDSVTEALVFRLTPSAFDGDVAWWGQSLATANWLRGRKDLARSYADSGLAQSRAQALASPTDPSPRMLYAVTLAHAGRGEEALAEARRAMALYRVPHSSNRGYDQLQLVRICIVAGKTEEALDELERLFEQPTYVTRKWLTVDPLFDSLRGNPRFERIVAG